MELQSHHNLLSKDFEHVECYHCGNEFRKQRRRTSPLFWILIVTTHILISISIVAVLLRIPTLAHRLTATTDSIPTVGSHRSDSSFGGALRFLTIQPDVDAWKHGTYTGSPSASSAAAWEKLQQVRGVAITPDEASTLNIPETCLSAGNGTKATLLGVQHNLHCIRLIHQVIYPSYYYPNQTHLEREMLVIHAGHCLEALRQSVMCTPDLTPRGVFWEDRERSNIAVNPSVKMECLDWMSLVGWMRRRNYTLSDLWEANPSEESEE
ncbi:MAG: hypothetical protein LQ338_003997 [Usnochroma carphineum]|nr:MAG: hypothetical protein LQ338_003997 [Usnochroma carphineum]